jgi:hypothetical protein
MVCMPSVLKVYSVLFWPLPALGTSGLNKFRSVGPREGDMIEAELDEKNQYSHSTAKFILLEMDI